MTRPPLDALQSIPPAMVAVDPATDLFAWSRAAAVRAAQAEAKAKRLRDERALVQAALEETPEWQQAEAAKERLKVVKQKTVDQSEEVQKARETASEAKVKLRQHEKFIRAKALGRQASVQDEIAAGTSRAIRDALEAGKVPPRDAEIELADGTRAKVIVPDAEAVAEGIRRAAKPTGKDAAAGKD